MTRLLFGCIAVGVCGFAALGLVRFSVAEEPSPPGLKVENLLAAQLESAEGFEVIMSRVTMPPNTSLPKHWHPGEEFAYVLEGSSILRRDGFADVTVSKGEAIKIALKQVHAAVTTDEGATILVFRVHEHGKPERVLVE